MNQLKYTEHLVTLAFNIYMDSTHIRAKMLLFCRWKKKLSHFSRMTAHQAELNLHLLTQNILMSVAQSQSGGSPKFLLSR